MHASIPTKLSLYDFARIIGIHPYHFAQIGYTQPSKSARLCDQVYLQYEWQSADRVSRETIAACIAEAEDTIEAYLGYRLAPSWEVDEWRPTEGVSIPELVRIGGRDMRGYGQVVKANWGHLISGGIQSKSLIEAGATITYTDEDADNIDETATVTTTVDLGTNFREVRVYYPDEDADDSWEIRPATVRISGTTATITFKRYQCVKEIEMEVLDPAPVDVTDDASFLETVDIYRVYNDPQTQVHFLWEPGGGCNCGESGCSSCSYTTQAGCLHLRGDPKLSLAVYSPAEWNSDTLEFDSQSWAVSRQPDLVRLYYHSGLRDKRKANTFDMSEDWKRIVAHYAASILEYPPCDCVEARWDYWREDLALYAGDSSSNQKGFYRVTDRTLDNPFGTRRGQLEAWNKVKAFAVTKPAVA